MSGPRYAQRVVILTQPAPDGSFTVPAMALKSAGETASPARAADRPRSSRSAPRLASPRRALRSVLRRWEKAAATTCAKCGLTANAGCGPHREPGDGRPDARRRLEGARARCRTAARPHPGREHHGQAAVVRIARLGGHARDHLPLQHDVQVVDVGARSRADETAAAWRCCRADCRRPAAAAALPRERAEVELAAHRPRAGRSAARRPIASRSSAARSRSISIASSEPQSDCEQPPVSAPRPGPISTRCSPAARCDRAPRCARSPPDRAGSAGRSACAGLAVAACLPHQRLAPRADRQLDGGRQAARRRRGRCRPDRARCRGPPRCAGSAVRASR